MKLPILLRKIVRHLVLLVNNKIKTKISYSEYDKIATPSFRRRTKKI